MTQRISMISGKSNQTCDVDYTQAVSSIIWWWISCKTTKWWDFEYNSTTKTIWSGIAFIEFDRNIAPLTTRPDWLANYYNDWNVPVPNNPNSYVWIELDPAKLADPLSICDIDNTTQYALWQWLGGIKFWPAYPTDRPIIKLYRFDSTGLAIDERQYIQISDCIAKSIFTTLINDIYISIKASIENEAKRTLKKLCISDSITLLPWATFVIPPILPVSKAINVNINQSYNFTYWQAPIYITVPHTLGQRPKYIHGNTTQWPWVAWVTWLYTEINFHWSNNNYIYGNMINILWQVPVMSSWPTIFWYMQFTVDSITASDIIFKIDMVPNPPYSPTWLSSVWSFGFDCNLLLTT